MASITAKISARRTPIRNHQNAAGALVVVFLIAGLIVATLLVILAWLFLRG
jgi:hypothetical protein